MGVNDPQDFEGALADERRRLRESGDVSDADREAIRRWLRSASGTMAVSSLSTYLRRLRRLAELAETPLVDLDADDYLELRFALQHDEGYADSTVENFENAFVRFVDDTRDVEWHEDLDRVQSETDSVDPDDILLPADIGALTDAARHERDIALIEFLADTGARLSLTLSLRVGDIDFEGDRGTYTPNSEAIGLKGAPITEYPLIDCVAPLRSYLRGSHPRADADGVALFHKLQPASRPAEGRWDDDGSIDPNALRQHLGRIADRAGVDKPVNPHAFRHAAVTRMVREGYSRSQIEHRVHWTLDSDMWATYEHITNEQHTDDIFRAAGLVDGDDGPDRVRKDCGACSAPLAPRHDFCPNCGAATTAEAEAKVDADEDTILEDLVEATNPQTRRELRALLDRLDERPDGSHDSS